jgi:hypothetical protein
VYIVSFFDSLDRGKLVKMLEVRVADGGNLLVRMCVQRRLTRSVGVSFEIGWRRRFDGI